MYIRYRYDYAFKIIYNVKSLDVKGLNHFWSFDHKRTKKYFNGPFCQSHKITGPKLKDPVLFLAQRSGESFQFSWLIPLVSKLICPGE